jgi:cell division protein FtsB
MDKKKVVLTLVIIVSSYITFNMISGIVRVMKNSYRLTEAREELERRRLINIELRGELNRLADPLVLEEMVREKLNLTKPGEEVVVVD